MCVCVFIELFSVCLLFFLGLSWFFFGFCNGRISQHILRISFKSAKILPLLISSHLTLARKKDKTRRSNMIQKQEQITTWTNYNKLRTTRKKDRRRGRETEKKQYNKKHYKQLTKTNKTNTKQLRTTATQLQKATNKFKTLLKASEHKITTTTCKKTTKLPKQQQKRRWTGRTQLRPDVPRACLSRCLLKM